MNTYTYLIISLTIVNIIWALLNHYVTSLHIKRKKRLIDWLEEVPEFWGIDKQLWDVEIKKWKS